MSKLNYPTLTRPQDPEYQPSPRASNVRYVNEIPYQVRKFNSKPSKHNNDALFGIVINPEYAVLIKNEKVLKKPTKMEVVKMKIARFIMCLANMIGENNERDREHSRGQT